ncbi:MAG: hypothetical protein U5R49_22055 [Deltaproteobacteria bacterium]|nr:hypothetical protein [Deltaproteobacteria bacterium]
MANIDNTVLTSDNPEVFDEITKDFKFQHARDIHREPGRLFAETISGVPHEEIRELSKKNPEMTFIAKYSFEYDFWSEINHVEYKAGVDKLVRIEPNYSFTEDTDIKNAVPCFDELFKKLLSIFSRLDVCVDDPKKGKYIDWCDAEVSAAVEHEGYRMSAKKRFIEIDDIRVFKAREVVTIEWDQVIDEIPF